MVPQDESLEKVRRKYPFDDDEVSYFSEFEDEDSLDFTRSRRKNKDDTELILRNIDKMTNVYQEGDDRVVEDFKTFMRNASTREEPSTINTYASHLRAILATYHRIHPQMDARDFFYKSK